MSAHSSVGQGGLASHQQRDQRYFRLVPLRNGLLVLLLAWVALYLLIAVGTAVAWHYDLRGLAEAVAVLDTSVGLAVKWLAAFLSWAFFLVWVFWATANLRVLRPGTLRIRPWWAVGWFFIPIANLWMSIWVMKQLSDPADGWIGRWWACQVVAILLGLFSNLAIAESETLSGLAWGLRLAIAAALLQGIALLFLIRIVSRVTRWQEAQAIA